MSGHSLSHFGTRLGGLARLMRRLRLGGWAGMKHHLVAIGVIPSTDADAPIEWQDAFCRAFGRKLTGGRNV